jgi:hypothetical protein
VGVALTMSWFYACCNVVNRKLKDVHFAILGFWHPVLGIALALIYIFGSLAITG